MAKSDAEIDREIAQSERLARLLIQEFDGFPAALVMHALAMVVAHAIKHQAVDTDAKATMALLTEAVELELASALRDMEKRAEKQYRESDLENL